MHLILPPRLKEQIRRIARVEDRPLNRQVRVLLERAVLEWEQQHGAAVLAEQQPPEGGEVVRRGG